MIPRPRLSVFGRTIFLTVLILINYQCAIAENQNQNQPIGYTFETSNRPVEKQSFFQMISKVPLNMYDIEMMYRNVTAEATTWGCIGKCRTPIALWVTQSIVPCQDILKEDCPKGLVCCKEFPKVDVSNSLKRADTELFGVQDSEWNESKFDPSTFRQDPIPGER